MVSPINSRRTYAGQTLEYVYSGKCWIEPVYFVLFVAGSCKCGRVILFCLGCEFEYITYDWPT